MSSFKKGFYEKLAAANKEVSAVAVIHNGKMLMGMRTKERKMTTPCGHLEDGETPAQGAVRELWEESGIKAEEKDLKFLKTIKKPDGYIIHGYRLDLKKFPKTTGKNDPDQEVKRWRFYDTRSIPDSKLHVPRNEGNVLLEALEKKAAFYTIQELRKRAAEKKHIMCGDQMQAMIDKKRGDGVDRGSSSYAESFSKRLKAKLGQD